MRETAGGGGDDDGTKAVVRAVMFLSWELFFRAVESTLNTHGTIWSAGFLRQADVTGEEEKADVISI